MGLQDVREVNVCTECDPNPQLDGETMILRKAECPIHGAQWHRPMKVAPDGSLILIYPLLKPAGSKPAGKVKLSRKRRLL